MVKAKQHNLLKMIVEALISIYDEELYSNEATLKHNFFHYLKLKNPDYQITVEENLNKHVKMRGRVDYFLNDHRTKSYKNDVAIEFKINCSSRPLIQRDLLKLDKIKKLDSKIAPLFINVFTKELNFRQYTKLKDLFFNTKVYAIITCPQLIEFYNKVDYQTLRKDIPNLVFIVNNARFLEQYVIPTTIPTIRLPNKGGMSKYINLYLPGREKWDKNKYIRYCEPE